MKKISGVLLILVFALTATAQMQKTTGNIVKITFEELNVMLVDGSEPTVGQDVMVYKVMQTGIFSGRYELAKGTVSKVSQNVIYIKPTEYKSTLVEDGVKRPMAKEWQKVIIEWEGKAQGGGNNEEEELKRVQTVIYDAQDLIKDGKYEEAIKLLKPEDDKYDDCYACSFLLGRAYLEKHDEDTAITYLTKVIDHAGNKYSMAYIYRARAYEEVFPRQYRKAVLDYEKAYSYCVETSDKVYVLEKILNQYDELEDDKSACATVERIKNLGGEERKMVEYSHQFCDGIMVPEDVTLRFDASVVSQSENLNEITVKMEKEAQNCLYSSLHGNIKYASLKEIKEGGYFKMGNCEQNMNLNLAVVKVKKVTKDTVELEVLYWLNTFNGEPWRNQYEANQLITLSW